MAWDYIIEQDLNLVFIVEFGEFILAYVDEIYHTLFDDPKYATGMNFCYDLRTVKYTEKDKYNFEFISKMSNSINVHIDYRLGECKLALTVHNPENYKLIHQWLVSMRLAPSPVKRKLFKSFPAALEWLGVPEEYEIKYPNPIATTVV